MVRRHCQGCELCIDGALVAHISAALIVARSGWDGLGRPSVAASRAWLVLVDTGRSVAAADGRFIDVVSMKAAWARTDVTGRVQGLYLRRRVSRSGPRSGPDRSAGDRG